MPVLFQNEWTRRDFLSLMYGHYRIIISFLSPTADTKFQGEPPRGDKCMWDVEKFANALYL